jgi:hypothetical protein
MQLKRSYFRRLKVLKHLITGFVSVPDVLTVQFDPLSKPVDPNSINIKKLIIIEPANIR